MCAKRFFFFKVGLRLISTETSGDSDNFSAHLFYYFPTNYLTFPYNNTTTMWSYIILYSSLFIEFFKDVFFYSFVLK